MAWFGGISAVVAIVAIGVVVWLWRQLEAERTHARDALYTRIDAENQLDALRAAQGAKTEANVALSEVLARLDPALASTRAHLEQAGGEFVDYREQVKRFDAAVQYCLQPVELIFGADKASLDQLVHHVEGARRKLFEARTNVEKHPLHSATDALDSGLGDLRGLVDYAGDLRQSAAATHGSGDRVPDAGGSATVQAAVTR